MAIKLFNLLAITTVAIFGVSFGSTPVNALTTHGIARSPSAGHLGAAKKRRGDARLQRRCAARTAPTAVAASPAATAAPTDQASQNAGGDPNSSSSGGGNNNNSGSGSSGGASGPAQVGAAGGGIGTGGKMGLAWGADPSYIKNFCQKGVVALYTWRPDVPQEAKDCGLEPVPMLWGPDYVDSFQQNVVNNPGNARYVLGFNEPNLASQANMSPQDACGLWQQYIQPLKQQGYTLISPATTSAPDGLTWMQDFLACCQGCTIDAMALHWYDVTVESFQDYVNLWHNTFNTDIWVTEFACQNYNGGAQCTDDYIYYFMDTVTKWMNNQDFVKLYAPFGTIIGLPDGVNQADELMNNDGSVSSLGWTAINNAAAL